MTKAYDLKELGKRLAEVGMPVAMELLEKEAGHVYEILKQWLKESAALSSSKIDDFAVPFIDKLDLLVIPLIEKINKEQAKPAQEEAPAVDSEMPGPNAAE